MIIEAVVSLVSLVASVGVSSIMILTIGFIVDKVLGE
jgi:hypothetical protein